MAEVTNKWIDAVTKLTKLTQDGELTWSSLPSDSVLVSDDVQQIDSVFKAFHGHKRLRLYRKRFKVEANLSLLSGVDLFPRKYPYWASQVYLEIVDEYGNSLWTFPKVTGLSDLLAAVKYQVSGVKEFLEDLLGEDEAPS